MLFIGKKIDYALISLSWMAGQMDRPVSAREIADANDLPLPALMQILKAMHQGGILRSTRGVKGGYQIAVDLDALSLAALNRVLCTGGDVAPAHADDLSTAAASPGPLRRVQQKLNEFLDNLIVLDLIRPVRRVDVLVSDLRVSERFTTV